jgi:hypothetical protein
LTTTSENKKGKCHRFGGTSEQGNFKTVLAPDGQTAAQKLRIPAATKIEKGKHW